MSKVYYTYDQIHELVGQLAQQVRAFNPTVILAIGGGGLVPARMMRTYIDDPVLVVTLQSYKGQEQQDEFIKHQWLDNPAEQLAGEVVLIVDELDDTGSSLAFCVNEVLKFEPAAVGVAVVHYKDKPKKATLPENVQRWHGARVPDQWIVYPWEVGSTDRVEPTLDSSESLPAIERREQFLEELLVELHSMDDSSNRYWPALQAMTTKLENYLGYQ